MKKFRKNEQEFFICEKCNHNSKNKRALSQHINNMHNLKNYYDKWIKEENEGLCKNCRKETKYINFKRGYQKCCSKNCEYQIRNESIKNIRKLYKNEILQKTKKTCLEKYGVENSFQSEEKKEKSRKTKKEKYGNETFVNPEKNKQTCLKKYGVENPAQNREIYNKGLKTRFLIHQYKDTNLTYQGSYELDFLNNFYDKINIENGPSIKYKIKDKNKVYHSDFFIPSLNLVIEIKSSWTLKLDIDIKAKKNATIANSFNYIMIIDKDYSNFLKIL